MSCAITILMPINAKRRDRSTKHCKMRKIASKQAKEVRPSSSKP